MKLRASLSLLLLFFLSLHSLPAHAHNGAIAVALPVSDITIDGDLSDWPAAMESYPIGFAGEEEDCSGLFRIGYSSSENALYLAVEVDDDSVVRGEGSIWNGQDGCELYVDATHAPEGDRQLGQFHIWEDVVGVFGSGVELEDFQAAAQRADHLHRYEWRVDIERLSDGQVRLRPGMSLGVDLVLLDLDEDGSFSWVPWRNSGGKWTSSGVGDVVLVDNRKAGALRGRLLWEEGTPLARADLIIRSLQSPALWVTAQTDRQGGYALDLPVGNYRIAPIFRPDDEREAKVTAGGTTELADLVIPAPRGQKLEIGPGRQTPARGRSTPAGDGQRQGAWQSLGVADGLPDPSVAAILQDRDGALWFATNGGGISRYDGETFTTFTTADGLASDHVSSILQTDDGILWFGTMGGVSSYDGEAFTTFSFGEEDQRENQVWSLLEDRMGQLWFGTEAGAIRFDGRQETGKNSTIFTVEDGLVGSLIFSMAEDTGGNIWFGTPEGASRFNGAGFENFSHEDGLTDITAIVEDQEGQLWFVTAGGALRYDGADFQTFREIDGLANNWMSSVAADRRGRLWFGTNRGGVSCYDGKVWKTFTTEDGLAHSSVMSILEDSSGDIWFGTGWWKSGMSGGNGVSRFREGEFTTFGATDGLPADQVMSLGEDSRGNIWIGTWRGVGRYDGRDIELLKGPRNTWSIVEDRQKNIWFGAQNGAFRYDGQEMKRFSTKDGLGDDFVAHILEDRGGNIWFATWTAGISRYDGRTFVSFDTTSGLADNRAQSIAEDREGILWFGTDGGVCRYDPRSPVDRAFTTYPRLKSPVLQDRDGNIWAGLQSGGVSRYDGQTFTDYTTANGLSHNYVIHIMQDRQGHLWFSTWGGGVSRFDGKVFQSLIKGDGLPHNATQESLQDREGNIWIATEGGAVRFRPDTTPPPVRITGVVADREYGPLAEFSLSTSQDYLAFEFLGTSFKTRPNQMVYLYQLEGYDAEQLQTRERQVAYYDLPIGEYIFRVTAVDRDLNYSESPAEIRVTVHPAYARLALIAGLVVALVGLTAVSGYALKKRRDLFLEMEEELQTAHEMQKSLMPAGPPRVSGFDIAGRCLPANHVGGDLFQYFQQHGKLAVCLADVTGHAMEAAIPVVMFNGILESQMERGERLEELFSRLNRSLHRTRVDGRTFVCFAMVEIDLDSLGFRLANGGCPYPYHYCAATGQVEELQLDAYPLGVQPDTEYSTVEAQLEPGDRIVFCSDGIAEAANPREELFGFERTAEEIRRGCAEQLPSEILIDRLIGAVKGFSAGVPQGDDITVVVVGVEA